MSRTLRCFLWLAIIVVLFKPLATAAFFVLMVLGALIGSVIDGGQP